VVFLTAGFSGSLWGISNYELQMISENNEYLCDRENFYCDKNKLYDNWIDDFDLYSYENRRLLLTSTENLNLSSDREEAFKELKNLKYGNIDKYNLSDTLISLLKISIMDKNNQKFVQHLNEINEKINNHNFPDTVKTQWLKEYKKTEKQWDIYWKEVEDPFTKKHWSLKGLGEHFVDSTNQLKNSARMGWNVSERTFLRPVKYAKQLKQLKDVKDLLGQPKKYYDLVMLGYNYLIKEKSETKDLSDSNRINGIMKLIKDIDKLLTYPPFNKSSNNVISLINAINQQRNILRQEESILILEKYYKENEFMHYSLNKTKLYLKGKSMQTLSHIIVLFAKLTALDKIDGLGDTIIIGNDLIQTFNLKVSGYRSGMAKVSLSKEYLKINLDSMDMLNNLYISFMKNINPYAKFHIANNKKFSHYSKKNKELKVWIADFEEDSLYRVDKDVKIGSFYKAVYNVTGFTTKNFLYIQDVEDFVHKNPQNIITLDRAIWMLDKFSLEAFKKFNNKHLSLYLSSTIRPKGKEYKRRINKIIFKKLGEHNDLYIKRQFITMQGRKITEFPDTLKHLDKYYVSGYKAIDLLHNYQQTIDFYYKGTK
jgi:hypothetical protein